MKIIDKNKDYYDYLQGVWGQDPKAVYARTGSVKLRPQDRPFFLAKNLPKGVIAWQGELILTCGATAHHIYFENAGNGIIAEEFLSHEVPRLDGRRQYVRDEGSCARFEDFQVKCHYAIFSIHDELIGHAGVLANQAACYRAGYQIMIDAEGGHRLRREVIRQRKREIFEKK